MVLNPNYNDMESPVPAPTLTGVDAQVCIPLLLVCLFVSVFIRLFVLLFLLLFFAALSHYFPIRLC